MALKRPKSQKTLKSVKFITDKFDEYGKERQEKNEIIKKLNEKVSALTE